MGDTVFPFEMSPIGKTTPENTTPEYKSPRTPIRIKKEVDKEMEKKLFKDKKVEKERRINKIIVQGCNNKEDNWNFSADECKDATEWLDAHPEKEGIPIPPPNDTRKKFQPLYIRHPPITGHPRITGGIKKLKSRKSRKSRKQKKQVNR